MNSGADAWTLVQWSVLIVINGLFGYNFVYQHVINEIHYGGRQRVGNQKEVLEFLSVLKVFNILVHTRRLLSISNLGKVLQVHISKSPTTTCLWRSVLEILTIPRKSINFMKIHALNSHLPRQEYNVLFSICTSDNGENQGLHRMIMSCFAKKSWKKRKIETCNIKQPNKR